MTPPVSHRGPALVTNAHPACPQMANSVWTESAHCTLRPPCSRTGPEAGDGATQRSSAWTTTVGALGALVLTFARATPSCRPAMVAFPEEMEPHPTMSKGKEWTR
jgi:hypothetical protein